MASVEFASPYIVGTPVPVDFFFGRSDQIAQFFNMLRGSVLQPLRVLGFRRSGKTSFLLKVADRDVIRAHLSSQKNQTFIAYVDLQAGVKSPDDFYRRVAKSITRAIAGNLSLQIPAAFPDFDSLKIQEDKIRNLDLVPRRSDEVQADYELVSANDFVRLVDDYYFANGTGMALVRETHPTDLPADVDQHVVWFKDGTTKEEVAEFIGEFLIKQWLGIEDVILFERSRKTKTPLVGAAIHKYRHIHIWTRKKL